MDDGGWGSANPIFLGYIAGLAVLAILDELIKRWRGKK